jgi:hypothetical protein
MFLLEIYRVYSSGLMATGVIIINGALHHSHQDEKSYAFG